MKSHAADVCENRFCTSQLVGYISTLGGPVLDDGAWASRPFHLYHGAWDVLTDGSTALLGQVGSDGGSPRAYEPHT